MNSEAAAGYLYFRVYALSTEDGRKKDLSRGSAELSVISIFLWMRKLRNERSFSNGTSLASLDSSATLCTLNLRVAHFAAQPQKRARNSAIAAR